MEETGKSRPMKVIFDDEKAKGQLMANLKKLGKVHLEDKFKNLSIMNDMTKKERQLNKEKWEEVKTKNDEAKSNEELEWGDFKYIVKEPP